MQGSRRHWDLIPWDDDLDIVTEYRGIDWLKSYLKNQTEWENLTFYKFGDILKLFFSDGKNIAGTKNWKYPFIDVSEFNFFKPF